MTEKRKVFHTRIVRRNKPMHNKREHCVSIGREVERCIAFLCTKRF